MHWKILDLCYYAIYLWFRSFLMEHRRVHFLPPPFYLPRLLIIYIMSYLTQADVICLRRWCSTTHRCWYLMQQIRLPWVSTYTRHNSNIKRELVITTRSSRLRKKKGLFRICHSMRVINLLLKSTYFKIRIVGLFFVDKTNLCHRVLYQTSLYSLP